MFRCLKCGECCRNLNLNKIFNNLDRGDGTCKYLKGNLCTIYENRPIICRVDESYDVLFKGKISKEEYYKLNYAVCKGLSKNIAYGKGKGIGFSNETGED